MVKRVFLIGFMGSGKSSVGRPLAKEFGMRFADMDAVITEREKATIAEIFERREETGFRKIEKEVLAELCESEGVVATGGGTPCFFDNMEVMKNAGCTVYLKLSPEGLLERLKHGKNKRPLLMGKTEAELLEYIEKTLAAREKFYASAHITVDCDGRSDVRVLELIAVAVRNFNS